MKIAILYICTGEYYKFWCNFYKSSQIYFCPEIEKKYFVFTDFNESLNNKDIKKIHQDNLGWPVNTLYRYRMFLRIKDELTEFDYIVFFNANCIFVANISMIDFFGINKSLVACIHPGFFNKDESDFTYEKRTNSKAFVKKGFFYFPGGIMGGYPVEFLKICKILSNNIEEDINNGLLAIWHDESHWNAYLNNNYDTVKDDLHILSPAYLYPEGWNIPFEKKILLRDKSKVLDIKRIKGMNSQIYSIINIIRNIF